MILKYEKTKQSLHLLWYVSLWLQPLIFLLTYFLIYMNSVPLGDYMFIKNLK